MLELADDSDDRRAIEEIRAVFNYTPQTFARLGEIQNQIQLCDLSLNLDGAQHQPRKLQRAKRGVLENEHGLNERRVTQAASRLQLFDQSLKGKILIRVCAQRDISHALEQIPESGIARQIGAQNQRVDEEPDQAFGLASIAVRNRGPDNQIGLSGVAQ